MRLTLPHLFENNRRWAADVTARRPGFFKRLAAQQAPHYLWIGCSDSRAHDIVGLDPGELFVHRNVANVVVHTDLNCLSVLQFAVDVPRVQRVIVYGCGGVQAARGDARLGLIDNWLRHVRDVRNRHRARLDGVAPERRAARLGELNVIEQAQHVCETTVAQDAWTRGQQVTVSFVDLRPGRRTLHDPGFSAQAADAVAPAYTAALDGWIGVVSDNLRSR